MRTATASEETPNLTILLTLVVTLILLDKVDIISNMFPLSFPVCVCVCFLNTSIMWHIEWLYLRMKISGTWD